jgi:hypothetical protein
MALGSTQPPHYGNGFNSASNINEYQEFMGDVLFNYNGTSSFVPVLIESTINIRVWNVEPQMRFQMCVCKEGQIYF